MTEDLGNELERIAETPILLVACDYDGTLAPIVADPAQAKPNREAVVALHGLAQLPQTHLAVISGRALKDLASLSGLSERIHLVGSHGSEFDADFAQRLAPELRALRGRVRDELRAIAGTDGRFILEEKPASVALHYRLADDRSAQRAVESIRNGPARLPGVFVKEGKKVVELSVVRCDKGVALTSIRHRIGATGCVYLGDDVTDEDAFATLGGPDVAVKVGDGASRARHRVSDASCAAEVLGTLLELREAWLKGAKAVPIERHTLLSDQRTVALLNPEARVVWMCLPRIDSPSLFAELIGGPSAGYFAVQPANGEAPSRQCFAGDTLLVQTVWPTLTVTDYLDCSGGRPFQRAGRSDLIRVLEGTGRMRIEFAPRLDFGREPTRLRHIPEGLQVEGSLDPIVLRAPGLEWQIVNRGEHQTATAEWDLLLGSRVLELRYGLSSAKELILPERHRREQTERFWTTWARHLQIPAAHAEWVRRSALVLKALCYGPTGAIAAAATTSLPEWVGGVRNWDYRYCWLRDAALAATALVKLGSTGQGVRFLDWVLGIIDRDEAPQALRPVYTVTGGHLSPEAEIRDLAGYCGSRPVRIGNAAAQQLQLDIFGPLMDLLALLAEAGAALSAEHWRLAEAVADVVSLRWREPDHGIWEIRGAKRHYVHSKAMCWMAVDRAIRVANVLRGSVPDGWEALRANISDSVLTHGWSESRKTFTATYDGDDFDAAGLQVGLSGLVPAKDPRFLATIDTVERELRHGATVYRYLYDDGLPGREGGFHLCTSWLIESYARVGRTDAARGLLEEFLSTLGPTGLAAEEYDPQTQRSLGNFPQLYSHVGLINAVLAVAPP
jgi:trehalose-phosphatase